MRGTIEAAKFNSAFGESAVEVEHPVPGGAVVDMPLVVPVVPSSGKGIHGRSLLLVNALHEARFGELAVALAAGLDVQCMSNHLLPAGK